MKLIQLTADMDEDDGTKPVWINPMNVTDVTISDISEDTLVTMTGDRTRFVKEPVEKVVQLINDGLAVFSTDNASQGT